MELMSSRHNKNRSNALNFLDCVDNADKRREDKMLCLMSTLLVGNWGRQRWRSDLTHTRNPWHHRRSQTLWYSRTSATASPNPLLFPDLSPSLHWWLLSAPTFMLLPLISFFFFFPVHKLTNINYIWHFMPHLRWKCAFYQRQVVKVQVGWADPCPSPAWPWWALSGVMGRAAMARRKAVMTSANINKFHSPWKQQEFISTGRIQKYIGWRKLGKLKMHSILPPLKWIPRGVQSV